MCAILGVERSERLRLASEPRQAIGIAGEGVGQDLQRDIAIELRVASPENLSHATLANLRDDFVDAEARAGDEGQRCREYRARTERGGDYSPYTPLAPSAERRQSHSGQLPGEFHGHVAPCLLV
jgi:hypothetical protein